MKKAEKKRTSLRAAIILVGKAHEHIDLMEELEGNGKDAVVIRSINSHLVKAISELDYLDKKDV